MTSLPLADATTSIAPRGVDDLDQAARRRRSVHWVGALAALLFVTLPLGIGIGPATIPPSTVLEIVGHHLQAFGFQE